MTKPEYHRLLGQAKMVFSASLQETLGIGLYEGLLCGATPFAPNRLSYSEMYPAECLYPNEWTENWDSYVQHKPMLRRYSPPASGHDLNLEAELSDVPYEAQTLKDGNRNRSGGRCARHRRYSRAARRS